MRKEQAAVHVANTLRLEDETLTDNILQKKWVEFLRTALSRNSARLNYGLINVGEMDGVCPVGRTVKQIENGFHQTSQKMLNEAVTVQ